MYLVKMLPQFSMLFIFNFGSINEEDENKYLKRIISKQFKSEEEESKNITKDIISECHRFFM